MIHSLKFIENFRHNNDASSFQSRETWYFYRLHMMLKTLCLIFSVLFNAYILPPIAICQLLRLEIRKNIFMTSRQESIVNVT